MITNTQIQQAIDKVGRLGGGTIYAENYADNLYDALNVMLDDVANAGKTLDCTYFSGHNNLKSGYEVNYPCTIILSGEIACSTATDVFTINSDGVIVNGVECSIEINGVAGNYHIRTNGYSRIIISGLTLSSATSEYGGIDTISGDNVLVTNIVMKVDTSVQTILLKWYLNGKVYDLEKSNIVVDDSLSTESENPVQNKVITVKVTDIENDISDLYSAKLIPDGTTIVKDADGTIHAVVGGLEIIVVATLPTASAETMGKIYLVPSSDAKTQNVKDEYITWLDGTVYKWEKIGSTQIDLSDYYTKSQIDALIEELAEAVNTKPDGVKIGNGTIIYPTTEGGNEIIHLPAYPTVPTITVDDDEGTITVDDKTIGSNDSPIGVSYVALGAEKVEYLLKWSGYSSGSYDGSAEKTIVIPTTLPASDVSSWAKQPNKPTYAVNEIFGLDAELSGLGVAIAGKADINHTHGWANLTNNANSLEEGASDVTDNTEILTSYASNNGFSDPNAVGKVYKRDAIKVYNYVKNKLGLATVATSGSYNDLSNKPISLPASNVSIGSGTITVDTSVLGGLGNPVSQAVNAGKISNLTTADQASPAAIQRRVWFSYVDNVNGRPAYSDDFTYQSSTGFLTTGGYKKKNSSDNFLLLGGGGHRLDISGMRLIPKKIHNSTTGTVDDVLYLYSPIPLTTGSGTSETHVTGLDVRFARKGKWICRNNGFSDKTRKRGWRIVDTTIVGADGKRHYVIGNHNGNGPDTGVSAINVDVRLVDAGLDPSSNLGYAYKVYIGNFDKLKDIVRLFEKDDLPDTGEVTMMHFYDGNNKVLYCRDMATDPDNYRYHSVVTLNLGIALNGIILPFRIELSNRAMLWDSSLEENVMIPHDDIREYYKYAKFKM